MNSLSGIYLLGKEFFYRAFINLCIVANGLQLQEVGDYEALNFLRLQNLIRSTKLHLTTEPPIFL